MAIDPKYLPEDPKVLQRMVLDLMAQLDRESAERSKIETLLRELLDARRNRKSEQLSPDQLALFAAAGSWWRASTRCGGLLEEVLKTMRERVTKFNVERIKPEDLASAAGPTDEE